MIITIHRKMTGSAHTSGEHVLSTEGNEQIDVLVGDVMNVCDAADARSAVYHRKYGLRHQIFSPDTELSCEQEKMLLAAFRNEMKVGKDRPLAMVKHVKQRADGSRVAHYHILVSECDGKGRVLDDKWTHKRNEKLSRVLEAVFGQSPTKGRHNRAVLAALEEAGAPNEILEHVRPLTAGKPALSRFSSTAHSIASRNGIDLPAISWTLKQRETHDPREVAKVLNELMVVQPFTVSLGRDLCLLSADKEFICSINRLMKLDKELNATVLDLLSGRKHELHSSREPILAVENAQEIGNVAASTFC
jgi:hypothetical protein